VAANAHPPTEYRIMGRLGFGGKFWNSSNRDVPDVDCYPEDKTAERLQIIDETNAALRALFSPSKLPNSARSVGV
jgi:hypothetical protein